MTMNMTRINIAEAKARLSQYVRRVKHGETILLCERNVPVAEIRPLGKVEESRARYPANTQAPPRPSPGKDGLETSAEHSLHPAWGAMAGTVLAFSDDFNKPEGDAEWEAAR